MSLPSTTLSRTTNVFSPRLTNFELGAITETNISDGVYRYTFADSPGLFSWRGLSGLTTYQNTHLMSYPANMSVGFLQANNLDQNSPGSSNQYNFSYVSTLPYASYPVIQKQDAAIATSASVYSIPYSRCSESPYTYTNYLGDVYTGYNYAWSWNNFYDTNLIQNNPITFNQAGGYVEINWNTIALNETTYTTAQRAYGRVKSGRTKLAFQLFYNFDNFGTDMKCFYKSKPRFYNTTISGSNLVSLNPSPPAAPTNFTYPGGRVFQWTEPASNSAYPYIYLNKWNGSAWTVVRQGFISDQQTLLASSGTKSVNMNTYTVPSGDGSGYFYVSVSLYDGYYAAWGPGAASNYISI